MILRGRVVAIPTDALYTLAADPFNLTAVQQVFRAKGRQIHRALPMLVRDALMVEELAREISPRPTQTTGASCIRTWRHSRSSGRYGLRRLRR